MNDQPSYDPPVHAQRPYAQPGWRSQLEEQQQRLPGPLPRVPLELLAVCALMGLAGLLTLWPVVHALPSTLRLIGFSGYATFGLFLLDVLLLVGLFGAACLVLAWRLAHADRVARGLSYVLLGGLGGGLLIGNQHPPSLVLVMLLSFAALGVLAGVPAVRAFFDGLATTGEPTSVLTARVLVTVWASCMIAIGVLLLPLHRFGGQLVAAGIGMLALAATALVFNKRLATGDTTARTVSSAGAAAYAVLLLIAGRREPGIILPLALAVGVVAFLWLPQDAQAHFGTSSVRVGTLYEWAARTTTPSSAASPPPTAQDAPARAASAPPVVPPASRSGLTPSESRAPATDLPADCAGLLDKFAAGSVAPQVLFDALGLQLVGDPSSTTTVELHPASTFCAPGVSRRRGAEQAREAVREYLAGLRDLDALAERLLDILDLPVPSGSPAL